MSLTKPELFTRSRSLSIIIPTYNEAQNITKMLDIVSSSLPPTANAEIVVVDDDSPDGTGKIAEDYATRAKESGGWDIRVITRRGEKGLSSAILAGIRESVGDSVVVMDSDFSHPPETITKMLEELKRSDCDIVVASRYVEGGSITGWPFKRKLISKGATKIAQRSLGIKIKDPMSGFFAFRRHIIRNIKFDAIGYKLLLEILVKARGAKVREIPYNFIDRTSGTSKLDKSVVFDYVKSVWRLYRYGKTMKERRTSVRFFSKAGRFYTVGASGLLVNYLVSFLFGVVLSNLWDVYATMIGILFSMTSNFFLNKIWTFEDRDMGLKRTLRQYGSFMMFSGIGAAFQLGMVYLLVDSRHMSYALSLFIAVAIASIGNFILNKKWTFREKVWG
ncbi:MAG TPA: glycosyltransferase family 2 protein [Candidatus Nitrosotalea sp.]|nr:glycosyltransferase family 2 protein [Candidatus Nitrosotalea sp.]